MKLPEHLALSFLIAQLGVQQGCGLAGTGLVLLAGSLPDLDSLTLLAGRRVYRRYHRIVGHGLPVALAGSPLLALFGVRVLKLGPFPTLWCWLQVALLAHLLTDVCFYRWPVQLLWPLSSRGWGFGLVRWNDLVPTLILYGSVAVALPWRPWGSVCAIAGLGTFALYLGWRAWWPWPHFGWSAWIEGNWAFQAKPFWRWLTGDFLT